MISNFHTKQNIHRYTITRGYRLLWLAFHSFSKCDLNQIETAVWRGGERRKEGKEENDKD
jgi:hypothetical protein